MIPVIVFYKACCTDLHRTQTSKSYSTRITLILVQREQRGSGLKLLLLAYHLICIPMAHEYWNVLLMIMIYIPGVASPVIGPINVLEVHHHKEEGCPKNPHPHRRSSPTRTAAAAGGEAPRGPLLLGGVDPGADQEPLELGLTSASALPGQPPVAAMVTHLLARIWYLALLLSSSEGVQFVEASVASVGHVSACMHVGAWFA